MGDIKSFLNVPIVSILFIVATLQQSWQLTVFFSLLGVIYGLVKKLSQVQLLAISVQFSFYININQLVNVSPSFLVLLLILLNPKFWDKVKNFQKKSNFLIKFLIWFFIIATLVTISIIVNLNASSYSSVFEMMKFLFAAAYLPITLVLVVSLSALEKKQLFGTWIVSSFTTACFGILVFSITAFIPGNVFLEFLYSESRLKGSFEDPNIYALSLIISIIFSLIYWKGMVTKFSIIYWITLSTALAMTNSRTGLIAFLVLAIALSLFTLFTRINRKQIFTWAFLSVFFLYSSLPAFAFVVDKTKLFSEDLVSLSSQSTLSANTSSPRPEEYNYSNQSIEEEIDNSTLSTYALRTETSGDVRFTIWSAAIDLWASNPTFGIGYGNFTDALSSNDKHNDLGDFLVHNTFLSFLTESGIFALLSILLPLLSLTLKLFKPKSFSKMILFSGTLSVFAFMNSFNLQNLPLVYFYLAVAFSFTLTEKSMRNLR
jgi:hypothetical protein